MKHLFPSTLTGVALACLLLLPHARAHACEGCGDTDEAAPTPSHQKLGRVRVNGAAPTSLPTIIPTTLEGIKGAEIERSINATDAEDALKYLPSLVVRKRYIGDYNHAVLSTRASGTGNSARSLVFADGIPLSNLLGNGASFAPRWGMVTPEEIARVDVLYGPFSAAYSGNAVGAVVDYQTRMPTAFEAHAKLGLSHQANELYGQQRDFNGGQASASVGSRAGGFSWWINANRLDSHGQPQVFATKLLSSGVTASTGTPVSGAVQTQNRSEQPWLIVGTATEYETTQDHLKAKLALELAPDLRLAYTLGLWQNESAGSSRSLLRDAHGAVVDNTFGGDISQPVNIDGRRYTLTASDFSRTKEDLSHTMQALSLKQRKQGLFDWELAASHYDYGRDLARAYAPTTKAQPLAGRITDQAGTGWNTVAAKGIWRPVGSTHSIDMGLAREHYQLRSQVHNTLDWENGAPAAFASRFAGNSRTEALFVQDAWALGEDWLAVLGLRTEVWRSWGGVSESAYAGSSDQGLCLTSSKRCTLTHAERKHTAASPKAALSHQISEDWVLKASTGRAVRFPTVSELYQGGVNALGQAINNNPDLRPERSWTSELSAEWNNAAGASLRWTFFHEDSRDALYSQLNVATNASTVQNIDHIRTQGLELAWRSAALLFKGLQLQGSLTYADSTILANSGYAVQPGDTIGKQQPRVPKWRATLLASWQLNDALAVSYGARYSGRQYGTLDNSDANGFAYQGTSRYFTTDVRAQYRIDRHWRLAAGVDNLNNYQYWNFHPYPQRTFHAELSFDL